MVLRKKCITNVLIIEMYRELFNDWNASEKVLLLKCTANCFVNEMYLETLTIEMH